MRASNSGLRLIILPFILALSAWCIALAHPQSQSAQKAKAKGAPGEATEQDAQRDPFDDWQKPSAVIVFSGQQRGHLEPCGCSPEFQMGGLARRAGLLKKLQQKNWPIVAVDLGGLLDDLTQQPDGKFIAGPVQAQAKLEIALLAMQHMGYTMFNVGPEDIQAQDGFFGLMGQLANINDPPLPRVLSANLEVPTDFEKAGLSFPYRITDVGGDKIAFIGLVGTKYKDQMQDPVLGWEPPEKVLAATMRKLVSQSKLQALLLYAELDEAKQLAQKFPDLDVIIYASTAENPASQPTMVGKTMLVTVGSGGKYTGVIGLLPNETRTRFELVALDDRYQEDPTVRQLLDDKYIDKLRTLRLVAESPKRPFERNDPERGFVGSKKCGECHESVYEFWKSTRHAHALETLVQGFVDKKNNKAIKPGKEWNPECVSCHTTGFAFKTGYDGTELTAHLGGNGCENCHGAGSQHVRLMSMTNLDAEQKKEAKEMVHLGPQDGKRNVCTHCHDHENSPKFDISKYWNEVDHGAEAGEDKKNWPKILEKLKAAQNGQ